MSYESIIENNCLRVTPHWWPKYAYHFTDVTNAVSILSSGLLLSRAQATDRCVMQNDNASKQVFDMTESNITSYVRFYFRPLTPTQYHNEGFKHAQLRYDGDVNANIPVPIFLVFDLNALLNMPDTRFSAKGQAGHGSEILHGELAFSQMPFDKIYSVGPCNHETISYRHAELLFPDLLAVKDSLRMILCRNEAEKATLLNLLFAESKKAYYTYKEYIRIANDQVFQRNGLFVEQVSYHHHQIGFTFSCTPEKRSYDSRTQQKSLSPVHATYQFDWLNKLGSALYSKIIDSSIDYLNPRPIMFKLPHLLNASILFVTLRFDGKIVCVFKQSLDEFEMM